MESDTIHKEGLYKPNAPGTEQNSTQRLHWMAWSADITYVIIDNGFVYLAAIIDWFSRYVLDWEISVTMDPEFCCATLARVLRKALPEIFNTDQGSQYTSKDHTGLLLQKGVLVSMDGKGRALDNVFVERLWRSVKQEEVYLNDYRTVPETKERLSAYFRWYNGERLHQSLGYKTPESIYSGKDSCVLSAS